MAEVVAVVTANAVGPPGTTVVFGQMPSAISPMLTLGGSLLSPDMVTSARSEASCEASVRGDRVAGTNIGRVSTSGTHPDGQSLRERISIAFAESWLDDFPRPQRDELIAMVRPFDFGSFERAVDHFFEQFDEFDAEDLVDRDLSHIIFLSLGLATSAAALEVARRRIRRRTGLGKDVQVGWTPVGADDLGFPDLPGSWSSRLT